MGLMLDLSGLSPTTREAVLATVRDVAQRFNRTIAADLESYSGESEARRDMEKWLEASGRVSRDAGVMLRDSLRGDIDGD